MADYEQPADALRRVRFFDGQFLTDQDFVDEQIFHLDRERRTVRSLGLVGVVDGLAVTAPGTPYRLVVSPGAAVDPVGRHLLLTEEVTLVLPTDRFSGVTDAEVRLFYRAQESEPARAGETTYRRWDETPTVAAIGGGAVAVAPASAQTEWDSDGVLLGRVSVSARGDVVVDARALAPRAGLDPRGPFRGAVGVLGDLAVGGEQASTNAAWSRALDVYGATSSRLSVRTWDITGVVGAHPNGYGAASGWVAGTETAHAASILTANETRLTVTSDGQIGIGTTTPSNQGAWGRVVDLVNKWNARYLVRAEEGKVFGFLAAHPTGVFGSAGGLVVGTESNHPVSVVTNAGTRLTVTAAGRVGVGTTAPEARLHVVGSGGQAVDLLVNGRLKSANNDGGLLVGEDRGVGGLDTNKIGLRAGGEWRLAVTTDGQVGIGTTTPTNEGRWGQVLDLVNRWNARYLVRAEQGGVFGFLAAHPDGVFNAAKGVVVGTESNHAVSVVTNKDARLTVTGEGNVGIGTSTPSVDGQWDRAVDLFARRAARYQVRTQERGILGFLGAADRGDPNLSPDGGVVLGTDTAHSVALVTNRLARLLVTSDGNIGIGDRPTVAEGWDRVVDIFGRESSRLLVRSGEVRAVVGVNRTNKYDKPDGMPREPRGMVVGTESPQELSLITGGRYGLTIDGRDIFCYNTLWIRPETNYGTAPRGQIPTMMETDRRWWFRLTARDWSPNNAVDAMGAFLTRGMDYRISDGRLKEDLRELDGAVALLSRLRGVTYQWNEAGLRFQTRPLEDQVGAGPAATDEEHEAVRAELRASLLDGLRGRREIGLVAQEVEAVLPELVGTDADGLRGVDYTKLTAVLVQAVNEQQRTITAMRRRLAALETTQEDDRA